MTACPKPVKQPRSKKKRPKTKRQSLVESLDTIVSDIVRQRDGWQCVQCGSRERPSCGHVIPRTEYGTRWDLANCHCQCNYCNFMHGHGRNKGNKPRLYISWFINNFGKDMWDELNRRADSMKADDWKIPAMEELLERYQDLYERMQHLGVYDHSMLVAIGAYGQLKGITDA